MSAGIRWSPSKGSAFLVAGFHGEQARMASLGVILAARGPTAISTGVCAAGEQLLDALGHRKDGRCLRRTVSG